MARPPRVDYPGAWHHVFHRGARSAPIFDNDKHCTALLALVGEAVEKFDIGIHAYSLMPNHYHFLVQSRHGNLSRTFQFINGRYTKLINEDRGWDGPLFRGRFRSQLISSPEGLRYVLAYIHLNPLRANLITKLDGEGAWTSHLAYVGKQTTPTWLETSHFLDLFGSADKLHEAVLSLHQKKTPWPDRMSQATGWLPDVSNGTRKRQESSERKPPLETERALQLVQQVTGANLAQLLVVERGRHANAARRFAVWALRDRTILTYRQIGALLSMSPQQVANVLSRFNRRRPQVAAWVNEWEDIVGSDTAT